MCRPATNATAFLLWWMKTAAPALLSAPARATDVWPFALACVRIYTNLVHEGVVMNISMAEVRKLAHIPKVIVHSLDLMLYQVSVELDGTEHMVTDSKGKMLRAHSTLEMQTLFEDL